MINLLKEYQAEITKLSAIYEAKNTSENPLTLESGFLGHPYARCLVLLYHKTFETPMREILLNLLRTAPNVFTEEFQAMSEQERGTWLATTVMGEPHQLVEVAVPEDGILYYCVATVNVAGIEQTFTDGENEGGASYSNDQKEIICLWSEENGYFVFNELFISMPESRVISKQLFKITRGI